MMIKSRNTWFCTLMPHERMAFSVGEPVISVVPPSYWTRIPLRELIKRHSYKYLSLLKTDKITQKLVNLSHWIEATSTTKDKQSIWRFYKAVLNAIHTNSCFQCSHTTNFTKITYVLGKRVRFTSLRGL